MQAARLTGIGSFGRSIFGSLRDREKKDPVDFDVFMRSIYWFLPIPRQLRQSGQTREARERERAGDMLKRETVRQRD
jgi:hypothetical protein